MKSQMQIKAEEALAEAGGNKTRAAKILGISRAALRTHLERAAKRDAAPEGVKEAVEATGLDHGVARHGWRIIPRDDGGRDSVFWKAEHSAARTDDIAESLKEALADIPPAKIAPPPESVSEDHVVLIPIADLHTGMMAWAKETGENYSTRVAADRLVTWAGMITAALPRSCECTLLFNGDTTHADDQTNATPRSRHVLDVDTRHFRTLDLLLQAIVTTADASLLWHATVRIVIKPGNHDPTSYMALVFALRAHYRDEPRVTVDETPGEFWALRFGKVMLMSHHGHKAKPRDLVLGLAAEFPQMWGQTTYRYLWTGHLHHLKQDDIGGVQWEQSRAAASRDAHAASHPYPARPEIQGVVYHKTRGETQRFRVTV